MPSPDSSLRLSSPLQAGVPATPQHHVACYTYIIINQPSGPVAHAMLIGVINRKGIAIKEYITDIYYKETVLSTFANKLVLILFNQYVV